MTMRLKASAVLLALSGCGLPANIVILLPDENGEVGEAVVHEGGSTAQLDKPLTAVDTGSEASLRNVFTTGQSEVDHEFAGALAAAPRAPLVDILYFQTGLAELDPRSRGDLAVAIAAARRTSDVDISVVGHADATGADPDNLALSLRRAETVRDALVRAGVPGKVIEITHHGANNPLIPTPRGIPEPRNRRVEVTIR